MRFLQRFFRNNYPVVLGRWSLKYDEKTVSRVVHQANEDHCGCCYEKKEEDYYRPFCLVSDMELKFYENNVLVSSKNKI